jgi:hypothetical protein
MKANIQDRANRATKTLETKVNPARKFLIIALAGLLCAGIIVAGYFVAFKVMKGALTRGINQQIESLQSSPSLPSNPE